MQSRTRKDWYGLTIGRISVLIVLTALFGLSWAQSTPLSAEVAHDQARALAAQADATYEPDFFDQNLWNQAAKLAEQAVDAQPNNTQYMRTLGEIYTKTQFWWQAYRVWLRLDELGALDPQARSWAALSAAKIGYIRMRLGLASEAEPFLEASLRWEDRSEIRALLSQVRRQTALAQN